MSLKSCNIYTVLYCNRETSLILLCCWRVCHVFSFFASFTYFFTCLGRTKQIRRRITADICTCMWHRPKILWRNLKTFQNLEVKACHLTHLITQASRKFTHNPQTEVTKELNPFTPKSDQCQLSPVALPEIECHTVWRTWLSIAYSDERYTTNSHYIPYIFLFNGARMYFLNPGLTHLR